MCDQYATRFDSVITDMIFHATNYCRWTRAKKTKGKDPGWGLGLPLRLQDVLESRRWGRHSELLYERRCLCRCRVADGLPQSCVPLLRYRLEILIKCKRKREVSRPVYRGIHDVNPGIKCDCTNVHARAMISMPCTLSRILARIPTRIWRIYRRWSMTRSKTCMIWV